MCTPPQLELNLDCCSATALRQVFAHPVRAFPSHLSWTVTLFRSFGVGPQSPVHVPVRGSAAPRCAKADAVIRKHAIRQIQTKTLTRIYLQTSKLIETPEYYHDSRTLICAAVCHFNVALFRCVTSIQRQWLKI